MNAQGIPLFVAELSFANQSFTLPSGEQHLRLTGRDVLWHKERLLNLLIKQLPPQYTKVAWIDADVIFPDERWYRWASGLLDAFDLIQLFDRLQQQDNDGLPVRELQGLAAAVADGTPAPFKFDTSGTWPGVAWAGKRELIAAHGLLDRFVLGGADTYMSVAAFNLADSWSGWHIQILTPRLRHYWTEWATPFFGDVQGRVGFVPTTVIQLGHGTSANRHYVDRMEILGKYDYDPCRDITPGEDGVWRWSSDKEEFHGAVARYFERRQEDITDMKAAADVVG
jgi:hypothetical protein